MRLNIKRKLIAIILSITLLILTVAFASIIIYNHITLEKSFINKMTTVAAVAANVMIGPLNLGDQYRMEGEQELEKVIEGVPAVKNVWVYTLSGELFVSYKISDDYDNRAPAFDVNHPPEPMFAKNYYLFNHPIDYDNQLQGWLYLRVSTAELDQMTRRLILTMLIIVAPLVPLSLFLASHFQGLVSRPILNLAQITQKVSGEGNYSIRVKKTYDDEVGMLYDGFNNMMEQIQKRDIQRDHAVKELKAAEFFLSSVMESMPSTVIAIDRDGIVTHWNHSAAQLTGIDAEKARGQKLWDLLPEFLKYKSAVTSLSQSRVPPRFYKEVIRINESTFHLNVTLFPLPDPVAPKYVMMINNVTDLEIKEQQLRQSQKMETVGTLAGGLAHDFNNVLGGIIGTISLFKYKDSRNKEITRNDIKKYFNTVEESANRASDLVQHLLSLTRKQELSFAPTDLNYIIKSTVTICKNTFDKSIEIKANYCREVALITADATQLEQSLLNLFINASHAMTLMRKPGQGYGGNLTVSLERFYPDKYFHELHPQSVEGQDYWLVAVEDTGVGMDEHVQAKIFDPFFTTKEEGKGTGLGLAMVYNIIKQHQGFIDLYSQEHIGTTFHIYLPVLAGKLEDRLRKPAEKIIRGEGLILVVDDEEIMRQTARSILEECGYTVLVAENGLRAVEIFKENRHRIKAVVLDMVMPKMSGEQAFLEMIKIDKNVKVLLASGFKRDSRVESIMHQGIKGFIQKPYALAKLANSVHRVLNDIPLADT